MCMQTKREADGLFYDLADAGIAAECIHGDKSQEARQAALGAFKEKEVVSVTLQNNAF